MSSCQKIPLEGAVNFRDLGGYRTDDGRMVRRGMVYRSDHLGYLTNADFSLLKKLGIRLVCDLRTHDEVARLPDRLPDDIAVSYLHLPVNNTALTPVEAFDRVRKGDTSWLTANFLLDGYLASLDHHAHVWGGIFGKMGRAGNLPLVFHCTGGKDRTGVFAAVILLFLGVPQETVLHDYRLSERFNAPRLARIHEEITSWGVDPGKLEAYLGAPAYLMEAIFDHLGRTYGSIDTYLETKAGLREDDLTRLRERLLVSRDDLYAEEKPWQT